MKYGLVYYKDTHNLGDDILTYAGKRFLPHVDYYIDREKMDVFVPGEKEYVAVIVNGWYLHMNYTFQPSPFIYPLFIGTHFAKDQMVLNDYSWIDDALSKYLNKYGPVGCRDEHTQKVLTQKNIKNYFSGCLTLTLDPFEDVRANKKIFCVDVSENVENYIQTLCPDNEIEMLSHRLSDMESGLEWNIREQRVIERLKQYQGAELVITTRLHCALPCLALGTPVILLGNYDGDFYARIACYSKYMTICSEKEILNHCIDQKIQNFSSLKKESILSISDDLRDMCNAFIKKCEKEDYDDSLLVEPELYNQLYVERTQYMRNAILALYSIRVNLQLSINQNLNDYKKVEELVEKVIDENNYLKEIIKKNNITL